MNILNSSSVYSIVVTQMWVASLICTPDHETQGCIHTRAAVLQLLRM